MNPTIPLRNILDICESGSRPRGGVKDIREGIPSLGGEHLNSNGGFNFKNVRYVPPAFAKSMTRGHLQRGDVLVVKDGATTGKVSFVRPDFPYKEAVINEHVFRIRPQNGFDSAFIYYFLFSRTGQHQILSDFRGAAQGGISQGFVDKVHVPVFSPKHQTRVVSKIEELFSELDATVTELKAAQAELKRYRASMLAAACSGKLVMTEAELAKSEGRSYENGTSLVERVLKERREKWNGRGKYKEPAALEAVYLPAVLPEGWAWASWEQLSTRVTVGYVGSMKKEYVKEGVPFLRSQNVRANRFDPEGLLHVSKKFHDSLKKSAIHGGDLAVVRSGSVGTTCVIPDTLGEANCSDLVLIQCPLGIVPEYGAYYMNSTAKKLIESGKVGVALTHFNTQSVARLPIPVPPFSEQQRIVADVQRRLSVIDELEKVLSANLRRAAHLRQSILQQAFAGKLVPQDASDESAAVLLERINTERASATAQKKVTSKVRGRPKAKKK